MPELDTNDFASLVLGPDNEVTPHNNDFVHIVEVEFDGTAVTDLEAQTTMFYRSYEYSLMDSPPAVPFLGRMICTDIYQRYIPRDRFVMGLKVAVELFFPGHTDVEHVSDFEDIDDFELFRCKDADSVDQLFVFETEDAGYFHTISMIGPIDMRGLHLPDIAEFANQERQPNGGCDLITIYNELIRMRERHVESERRDGIVTAVGNGLIEPSESFEGVGCIGPDNLALVLRLLSWD
jgi:hypothetical protein